MKVLFLLHGDTLISPIEGFEGRGEKPLVCYVMLTNADPKGPFRLFCFCGGRCVRDV